MPPVVVAMGVAGSGKSSLGAALAARRGWAFQEGDALHSDANVAKMRAGIALDDTDRAPWLEAITGWIAARVAAGEPAVVTCSALKRAYRDRLRATGGALRFVLLDPPRAVLRRRLAARTGHFMPAALLDSQLVTLERPGADEGVLVLTGNEGIEDEIAAVTAWLDAGGDRTPTRRRSRVSAARVTRGNAP